MKNNKHTGNVKKWDKISTYYTFEDLAYNIGIDPATFRHLKDVLVQKIKKIINAGIKRDDCKKIKELQEMAKKLKERSGCNVRHPIMKKEFFDDGYIITINIGNCFEKKIKLNKNEDIIEEKNRFLVAPTKKQKMFMENKITKINAMNTLLKNILEIK